MLQTIIFVGKWLLLCKSWMVFCRLEEKGLEAIERSIAEEKLDKKRNVGKSSFIIIKLKTSQAREIISPWEFVLGSCQFVWCALKSPRKKTFVCAEEK